NDSERAFTRQLRHVRAIAEPAYRACAWPAQDAANRAWIEAALPGIEAHGAAIARQLSQRFGTSWHGLPIRVDMVGHAPPVGANTIVNSPEGGHILMSSANDSADMLEILYHEASHTIANAWRKDPLHESLSNAAAAMDVELPRDLWHVIMFHVTGETVREVLADAGQPGYQTYMERHGLWQGRWGQYREAVEEGMAGLLDGTATLDQAVWKVAERLGASTSP
ncbi:MAG: hypothetical protein R3348_08680, partial [Xanthomonadales bacterium]|nr:hypothetical protein [Xanthomonadales bacterium]